MKTDCCAPKMEPIAATIDPHLVDHEIGQLPASCLYHEKANARVYIAPASMIPKTLHEIGVQREIAFRAVGEGSGKSLDLDAFDAHYLHIFAWDHDAKALIGAYRMGLTDEITNIHGTEGLYCSSLFHFEENFLNFLNPALEMGRSFVSQNYQKSLHSLAMLWRGVGQFAIKNPRYRRLFGPVSISREYTSLSQSWIVQFLQKAKLHPTLASLVKPKNPFETDTLQLSHEDISETLTNIQKVSARISELEPDGKGIPVLLKQYLKLEATLLSFNVDPHFCNVLDALVLVDFRQIPNPLLKRYFGPGWETLKS